MRTSLPSTTDTDVASDAAVGRWKRPEVAALRTAWGKPGSPLPVGASWPLAPAFQVARRMRTRKVLGPSTRAYRSLASRRPWNALAAFASSQRSFVAEINPQSSWPR
ncbi:hypothetical protein ACN28S_15695 [Cystobacter fuscus]